MNKQSRISVFKQFTKNLATLSKCTERQVAAIITDSDLTQVLSIGVNGGPKDLDDCLCVTAGKYGCVHAEINALIKCNTIVYDKIMFITLAPCKQCATAIVNTPGSFQSVIYFEDWKGTEGLEILREANIRTIKI